MPAFCGAWSAVATDEEGVIHAVPLRCRSWGCPVCAARNKQRLKSRLSQADAYSLITLTANPAHHTSPTAAFRAMSHSIDTLIKRVRRKWCQATVEYFVIWERTKLGWPHCHIIFNGPYMPQSWLSANWDSLTHAPIVDIRRVHSHAELTSYVAKYLAKDPQVPSPMKRYRCSHGFFTHLTAPPPGSNPAKLTWHLEPTSTLDLGAHLSRKGYTCRLHPDESVTAWPRGHPQAPLMDSFTLRLADVR